MNSPSSPVARNYFLRVGEKPWERSWFEFILLLLIELALISRFSLVFRLQLYRFALLACSVLATNPWESMWRRQIRSNEMFSYLQLFHLARPQSSLTSPWWRQADMMHYTPPPCVRRYALYPQATCQGLLHNPILL